MASRLHKQLAQQILDYIETENLAPPAHLPEPLLCEQFNVSRTPIRAALSLLTRDGHLHHVPRKGYFVERMPESGRTPLFESSDEDQLYLTIAEDRMAQRLPASTSEADLLRRYDVSKSILNRVLHRLAREGLAERRPGRGWMFAPVVDSEEAHDESYRFRLALEPVSLLEPGFRLDEAAAGRCEESHQRILDGSVTEISPIELFEINAEFHEMLAASTRNRFFLEAIRQQNRLRRFGNYHWVYGPERAIHACREHMSILQAVRSGNMAWASTLMRHHLEASATISPYSEGASAPQRIIRFD